MVTLNKLRNKKIIIILVALTVLIGIGYVAYDRLAKDSKRDGLSAEDQAAAEETLKAMQASEITSGIDPSRIREIDSSIQAKDFAGAKKQIDGILADPNLPETSKAAVYTQLSRVCLPLSDFGCADTVIDQYGKSLNIDYYFLVDAARLAKQQRQNERAQRYYKIAYDDIESKGGQTFVDTANQEASDMSLDYGEIKQGAGS